MGKRGRKPVDRRGKEPGTRFCITCNNDVPVEHFNKAKGRPDGLYPECRTCSRAKRNQQYAKSAEIPGKRKALNSYYSNYTRIARLEVLEHYGNKCACCGESQYEFLSIDHTNGDGSHHRRLINGTNIVHWLRRRGFPEGFRILCHNCNFSRGRYGYCPHNAEDTQSVGADAKMTIAVNAINRHNSGSVKARVANRQLQTTRWLQEALTNQGQIRAVEIWERAKALGFKIRQVKIAAKEIGVIKESSSSLSVWVLPNQS